MAFDLEKFYENEVFSFAKLNCRCQQLLVLRRDVRDYIKWLKKGAKILKQENNGFDGKECRNRTVRAFGGKINEAKIRKKQLGNQLKKVRKLINAEKKIFSEVFPCRVEEVTRHESVHS